MLGIKCVMNVMKTYQSLGIQPDGVTTTAKTFTQQALDADAT